MIQTKKTYAKSHRHYNTIAEYSFPRDISELRIDRLLGRRHVSRWNKSSDEVPQKTAVTRRISQGLAKDSVHGDRLNTTKWPGSKTILMYCPNINHGWAALKKKKHLPFTPVCTRDIHGRQVSHCSNIAQRLPATPHLCSVQMTWAWVVFSS